MKLNQVDNRRIQILKDSNINGDYVVYWMSRDQRVHDNWALLYAQQLASQKNLPFFVVFCLDTKFKSAPLRQFDFMLKGLMQVEKDLNSLNIPFVFLKDSADTVLSKFCNDNNVNTLVTDFSPLKIKKMWLNKILSNINCSVHQVDAHNIVPCLYVSDKCEFAAYTIRPKIHKLLDQFLTEFIKVTEQSKNILDTFKLKVDSEYDISFNGTKINWDDIYSNLKVDSSVRPVNWIEPGSENALKMLDLFIAQKFLKYDELRNNPNFDMQSNLSPYLHYGHICAQTIALKINKISGHEESKKSFLEELIVRKELSDNYCYYNENYDNFNGFHDWAKKSLTESASDKREYIYTKEQLENSQTHDELWNAAQLEMVVKGKMHGYLRMYWAKKILEWTPTVQQAQQIAIYLNDKYELDGRDPNGYTGIAWSIGGVHDRAWFNRPVFGKIRFMSYSGCKSKFDIKKYVNYVNNLM